MVTKSFKSCYLNIGGLSMKNILTLLLPLILTGCGGGGGGGGSSDPIPAIPEPPPAEIFKTKVIDGYVSGANIYIDNNWNFQQDANEPSAYENTTEQFYYFLEDDFSGINNWSIECSQKRPRIAEIPVGAIDSVRGELTSAYEMYYLPYFSEGGSGEQGEYRANITPLTTLFIPFISDELEGASIDDADGCGTEANNVANSVLDKVENVLTELSRKFDIDVFTFYDDFIASGDAELQAYGETIVDFLQVAFNVGQLIESEYQVNARIDLDSYVVERILEKAVLDSMTYSFFSQGEYTALSDGYQVSTLYAVYDVLINSEGELVDTSGNIYALTIDNLKANTRFWIREMIISDNALIEGNRILLEKRDRLDEFGVERFIHFSTFSGGDFYYEVLENDKFRKVAIYRIQGGYLNGLEGINLYNSSNPYFDYDLESLMASRDINQLQAIWDDINEVGMTIEEIDKNRYLLLDGDNQVLNAYPWSYIERQNSSGLTKQCANMETGVSSVGEEAYELCLQMMSSQ